jgi:hypothetical protein
MRVVATVIALVLLASNVYGDRESVGGEDNKLMRDLDVCVAEAPTIGLGSAASSLFETNSAMTRRHDALANGISQFCGIAL